MKAQSFPKFLLAAAAVAVLSGYQAFAQNSAAAAPAAAIGRSGPGAAQQDQITAETQKTQKMARRTGAGAADASLTIEQPFVFKPPTTKTRLGLTKDEQEKLDQLGAELVSFVDENENIEKVRQEQVEVLAEEAKKRKDEADQRLRDARVANRDAATDLLGAKREEKRAKDDYDKKMRERAEISNELKERQEGNRVTSQENAERQERIEQAKEEVSKRNYTKKEAEDLLDKARSEEKALEEQLDANEKAFTSATNEVARSQESLQKSKETEKTAEEDLRSTIKTGEENIAQTRKVGEENIARTRKTGEENVAQTRKAGEEAVAQARKNGEQALNSARDEANAAARDKAARDSEEKAAASAKRAAEKAKAKADKASLKADAALLAASRDTEDAKKALAEAKRKDQETKGWFSRLFIPSVEKAERRARKAEMAVGKADGEKKLAEAKVAKSANELTQAEKKFDASKAAAAAAGKELEAREAAVVGARRKLDASVADAKKQRDASVAGARKKLGDDVAAAQGKLKDDVAAAKRKRDDEVSGAVKKLEAEKAVKNEELSKARKGVATAEGVLRDSRQDAARKKDAVEDTKDDLASATREVGRSEKVVEKRGDHVEEAEAQLKAIEAENGNPLEFVKESELKDRVQNLNHEIRDLQSVKDKAEKAVEDKDKVLKRSEDGLKKASDAFSVAEAKLNSVSDEALDKATQAEKERQGKIEANAKDFWNKFIVRAERDAPSFVNADPGKLREALDAAAAARKAREADLQKAEKDNAEAKAAFGAAEKALSDAEKASKAAIAAAKDDAGKAKAQKEGETAIAAARDKVAEARKAMADAGALADKAKRAFSEAKAGEAAALKAANSYDGELKDTTSRVLSDAEKLKRAFYAAVEEAREARRDEKRRRGWSEHRKRHEAAIKALKDYRKAKRDYAAAEKEYNARVHEARDVQKMAGWKQNPDVIDARGKRMAAREAFKKAEAVYNQYYSDDNTFRTAPLSDENALTAVKRAESRFREEYGKALEFDGDRLWLARTSVNGIPLMDSFFEEMEWQADTSADPADTVGHAKAAVDYVRERAIYGGFYFAGLDASVTNCVVNQETGDTAEKLVVFVDKGRFGPTTVEFVAPQANGGEDKVIVDTNNIPVVDGKAFRRSDIISRFVSRDAGTNDLERQAFNFVEFRKNFNALNADPDIRKANVEFSVARPDFDYDYDYGETNARPTRVSRAILTKISVDEDPNLINRILPRPIAPIHGVLAVDNFNSMGEFDQIGVEEPDTWMARLTLQNQHRFFDRDAALTLNGNYSLGGSLYGGAANYFVARSENLGWADGGWRDWAFTVHGGYTEVDQEVLTGLDVLGTGYYGGLQASTRLVDTLTSALDFSLGLTYRYVESSVRIRDEGRSDVIPLGPNGGDGYEILPLSAALMYSDKQLDAFNGRNYATVEAVYNLGVSSADELMAFRPAIDDELYLIIRAQLARIQLLGSDSTTWWMPRILFVRADAQWASTPVIGAEQYGLGGHGTVRGYVEREFMGDSGASGTVEFRTPINLLSIFSDVPDNPYQAEDKLQLVYFADGGWFTLQDGLGTNEDSSEFIASLGLGLRYAFRDLIFRFDWGFPLVSNDIETSSAGVAHLSLQYQF